MSSTKKVLGFGNPLLDISVDIGTGDVAKDTLAEWGAEMGNAILAEEKHQPLYAKISAMDGAEYIAGGATLNSIRVAQWALTADGHKDCSSFVGCIGKDDEFGAKMKKQLSDDGVAPLFQEVEGTSTGTCAVLVMEKERSLIANLAAAEKYSIDHFSTPDVKDSVDAAGIFYMAGFPLTHEGGQAVVKKVCEHALAENKALCMNISAPFIAQVPFFRAQLLEAFVSCTHVFCNESEAAAFGEAMEWEEKTVKEIAGKLAALPNKREGGLTAVVTQGADCTFVAKGGNCNSYDVKANPWSLEASQIIDSNGAGDAFVGGFISKLATGGDEAACVRMGHFAAGAIIQQSGCKCPSFDSVKQILA